MEVLIVDDEHSGRASLKILLQQYCSGIIEVIDLAATFESAKQKIAIKRYDIIFLDIQLSTGLGFELSNLINEFSKIIYVTAFSEYAIKAIKNKAYDYILKPVNPEELNNAVLNCFNHRNELCKKYLNVKNKGITIPIEQDKILFLEADGPYCLIQLKENVSYISAQTLKSISKKLNQNFIRIHKTYLVNKLYIKGYNQKEVIISDSIKIRVSRTGLCELQKHFGY